MSFELVSKWRNARVNLPGWVGRPQVHAAGCLLSLMAVLAVVAFMIGTLEYTKTRGKLLLTALLVAGYFLTMLGTTPIPRAGAGPWFRATSLAAATVAVVLMALGLWGAPDSDSFWKATAIVTVLAIGAALVGVALPSANSGRMAAFVSMVTAGTSAALALLGIVGIAVNVVAPVYWWVFGVLAVAWAAMSLSLMVMRLRGRGTSA